MIAKLIIPKGFRVVKKPNFNRSVFVLMTSIDAVGKLVWKDATYEPEPFEVCLYIFIEKKEGVFRKSVKTLLGFVVSPQLCGDEQ